jgi:hypothetical protein
MEQQVLKIIKKRINQIQTQEGLSVKITSNEDKAKEITSMVFEFIKWFTGKDSPVSILYGDQPERFATTEKDYTIEELFQYWWDNVKNK